MSIWFKAHPGWLGLGTVAILFAGLAAAWSAVLPIKTSSPRLSGAAWCRDQAPQRPFVKLVNQGVVGNPHWPSMRAYAFWLDIFDGPPRLGTEQGDYRTVAVALGDDSHHLAAVHKIPTAEVQPARAAALRLDHYCAAS